MRFSKSSFFVIFFYVLLGTSLILQSYNDQLRYAKYFVPLFLLGAYLATTNLKRKIELDDFLVQQLKVYGVLTAWSFLVLMFKGFSLRFFQEVYFVLSPLLTLFILQQLASFRTLEKYINIIFYMLVVANLVYTGVHFFDFFSSASSLSEELLTSVSSAESPYAFDFGLFCIYYFLRKKKIHGLAALLFSIVSFKRIVLLGLVLVVLLFLLLKRYYQKERQSRFILWTATIVNVFLVVNIYLFSSGFYDNLIESKFDVSANYLSQGRYLLYQGIFEQVKADTFITGLGFGSISHYLITNEAFLTNLHSDILKVFLEFGGLAFVFWIFQFYKHTSDRLLLLVFSVFVNIMFITDNVFVYYDVMVFYYMFIVMVKANRVKAEIA